MTNLIRLFGICLFGIGCGEESETDLDLFNATTDTFEVSIATDADTTPQEIELHSSTGQVIIGTAVLTPGGGPVGTEHQLVVEVADTWQGQVEEVIVTVDSGDRGTEEFTLKRDSADPGYHQIDIISVGEDAEIRTDVFTVQLFANDSNPNTTDTGDAQ